MYIETLKNLFLRNNKKKETYLQKHREFFVSLLDSGLPAFNLKSIASKWIDLIFYILFNVSLNFRCGIIYP